MKDDKKCDTKKCKKPDELTLLDTQITATLAAPKVQKIKILAYIL